MDRGVPVLGQSSRSLPQARRIVGFGDENALYSDDEIEFQVLNNEIKM